MKAIYGITALLAVIGVYLTYTGVSQAKTVFQEIESLTMGMFFAIVPYVISR